MKKGIAWAMRITWNRLQMEKEKKSQKGRRSLSEGKNNYLIQRVLNNLKGVFSLLKDILN